MTRSTDLLKAALVVACFTPPLLKFAPGAGSALGQDAIVANGAQQLMVGQASGQVPVSGLPSFTGNDPNKYHGEAPSFSQNIQYDHNGNLLFFVLDGRVYDREGYLIADNSASPSCSECLFKGIGQYAITLVPGSCTQYYLVAAEFIPSNNHALGYAILDLEQPNPHWPLRSGRVLSYDDIANDQVLEAQFGNAIYNAPLWGDNDNGLFQSVSDCMINLDEEPEMTFGYENGLHLALFDTDDLINQKKLLFAVDEASLYYYEITSNGIVKTGSFTQGEPLNSSSSAFGNGTRRPWGGTCAFGKAMNTDLLFAMSATETDLNGGPVPSVFLFRVGFNGTVEWLQDITSCTQGTGTLEVTGMVFSPDAQTLYLLQNQAPYLSAVDLNSFVLTDLSGPLAISNPSQFALGTLSLDKAPTGSGLALYALSANRAACKLLPDQPVALNAWVDPLPVNGSLGPRPTFFYANGNNTTLLPDMHNHSDQQTNTLMTLGCCITRFNTEAVHGGSISGQPDYDANNNPWGSNAEVVFDQDVVIETGAVVDVTGMTWHFSENARLIVRRGAIVNFNACTLTSYNCPNVRWPGIRVEGETTDHTQHNGAQGILTLNNGCEVQNAMVGIWCARETSLGVLDGDYFGGWARATNTTFRNCLTGVQIQGYERWNPPNNEVRNLCRFSDCRFLNDAGWPIPSETPRAMALLYQVNGVEFANCEFRNDAFASMSDPNQRGLGIVAQESSFDAHGNMLYAQHGFRNLTAGVLNWEPDPLFVSEVDGMDFVNNKYGIMDFGSDDAIFTNNQFSTLDVDPLNGEASVGLALLQSERYTVERNLYSQPTTAQAPGVGIWFLGPTEEENQIYDNTFNDLMVACLVQGDHVANDAVNNETWLRGLQMLCGDHTGNFVDQMILEDGYIKRDQGKSDFIYNLAGNRFFSTPDCDGSGGSYASYEPWVDPAHLQDMVVQYFHHDMPECRPECVDNSWIDDYYDLILPNAFYNVAFDKVLHCPNGDLDQAGGNIVQLQTAYALKSAELASALANYKGTIDGGNTNDLIEFINHEPWYPSYQVRDVLLNNPLSDEAMYAAIERAEPLDPMHLVQMMLNNLPPRTPAMWMAAEQALPPYYYNLMNTMYYGYSSTGVGRTLEMEISAKQQEMARLQHRLLCALAADSTYSARASAVDSLFALDTCGHGALYRYQLALHREDWTAASQLEAALTERRDWDVTLALGQMREALNGDWQQADSTQRAELVTLAAMTEEKGSGSAYAAALAIGEMHRLPEAILPVMGNRSMSPSRRRTTSYQPPALVALPNPTTDRVVLTYPIELAEGSFTVVDVRGRTVLQQPFTGFRAGIELDLSSLDAGLYLIRMEAGGFLIGETKVTVLP